MKPLSFPAAHAVATAIHSHLLRPTTPGDRENNATIPEEEFLAAMLDAAFWASLRREEGYLPRISLAFVSPQQSLNPLTFAVPQPLHPEPLTKLATAAERPGIHLGVWTENAELRVWGATRSLPPFCLVLEVVAPGFLVIKQTRRESGKFINLVVLQGDEIKVIDQEAAKLPDIPHLLISLLGLGAQSKSGPGASLLGRLAVSMRSHGHGGTLLVVPTASEEWRESILHPITYAVSPAFSTLADLIRSDPAQDPDRQWQDAVSRAIDAVAGVTAVDGAAVLTANYELLAFGAKILRRAGSSPVSQVIVTEPIQGGSGMIAEPGQLGGTRHLSAAQFVHDQRDSIALVASQDGRFTVFAWSPAEEMVHAHRIDVLLL